MAGFKFWEWETDEERRQREAEDFVTRAQQEQRDVDANRFVNDVHNWLGDRASDVGNKLSQVPGALQGGVEGAQESYFNLARKVLPEEQARGVGNVLGASEPLLDAGQNIATGALERLGVPGGAETGLKSDVVDILGKAAPGFGIAQDLLGVHRIKTGMDIEYGPRELATAPLMMVNPLGAVGKTAGKAATAIEGATTVAGKFAKELEGAKDGFDILDRTPITQGPFPDEGIKNFVSQIKTLVDETGGATYSVHTGDKLGSPEYAIGAWPNRSRVVDGPATEKDIKSFIEDNKQVLKDPRTNVGVWENEGKTYYDLSLTVPDEDMAKEIGKHFDQLAIYDLKNNREIMIGDTVAGKSEIGLSKNGDNWYAHADDAKAEQKIHIGEGGLVRADDTAGHTWKDLEDMGYKGVYYPESETAHLFGQEATEAPKETPSLASKVITAGAKLFSGTKSVVPEDIASKIPTASKQTAETIREHFGPDVADALDNHFATEWTDDGLAVNLHRFQNPDAAGKEASRGGVFYGTSETARNYRVGNVDLPGHVGGNQEISGRTIYKNPMVVVSRSEDSLVDAALSNSSVINDYERKRLMGIADKLRTNPDEAISEAKRAFEFSYEDLSRITSNLAPQNFRYALKELYLSDWAREHGVDGIIGMVERGPRVGVAAGEEARSLEDYLNDIKYYQDSMEGAKSAASRADARTMYQQMTKAVQDKFGINAVGMNETDIDNILRERVGRKNLDIFEVFDTRENKYPTPEGDFSLFDVFKPVGDALQQVPPGAARSGLEGAIAGGVQGWTSEDDSNPVGKVMSTIEGAALGAAERTMAKSALNSMVNAGVDTNVLKSFNYKMLKQAPYGHDSSSFLKMMYSSMLSTPATVASQALAGVVETPIKFIRDLGSDILNKHPENIKGDFQGWWMGMQQGAAGFTEGMKNLAKDGVWEIPTNAIAATDLWTKAVLYGMSVGHLAGRKADELGLSAVAKSQFIKDALDDPVKAGLHDEAYNDAMRAVYAIGKNPVPHVDPVTGKEVYKEAGEFGKTGQSISNFANSHPLFQMILPFVGVAHRMGARAVEMSPLGLMGTTLDVARGVYDESRPTIGKAFGDIENVTPLGERLGNNILGTVAYVGMYQQAKAGNITAYGPADQSTRDAMIRQGWQPYSIKVGDTYYDYRRLGPIAMVLAMAATPAEIEMYNKKTDWNASMAYGMKAFAGLAEEMTYLRGISEVMRVFDTTGDIEPYLETTARRFVPFGGALNAIANAFDPKMRDVHGIPDEIKSMIPFVRQTLPERQDTYGQDRPNPKFGLAGLSPSRKSEFKPNEVDQELARLDLPAGRIPERLDDGSGTEQLLTDAQKRQFQKTAGDGKRVALQGLMATKEYQNASDQDKKTMLATVTRHASQWAREDLFPNSTKDAELAMYNGDSTRAGVALVEALKTKAKLTELAGNKYLGKSATEAKEIDNYKSALAAFKAQAGETVGEQAFANQYGYKALIQAKTVKPTKEYTLKRATIIKNSPDYTHFFREALDPNEVETMKQLVPA